jgi:hypothetical protein
VAQAARGSGSAGSGRARTAPGATAITGFAFGEAVWQNDSVFYSAEGIRLHSTAVNASSLLLIFPSKACNRSVVTVRVACMTAASRACNGSPIVFWREDWHRLTDTYADEHTPVSIYARKKKKKRR